MKKSCLQYVRIRMFLRIPWSLLVGMFKCQHAYPTIHIRRLKLGQPADVRRGLCAARLTLILPAFHGESNRPLTMKTDVDA
jgi:hypothetical protein